MSWLLISPLLIVTAGLTTAYLHGSVDHETSKQLPSTSSEDWISLANGLEFQPGHQDWNDPRMQAARDEAQSRLLGSSSSTAWSSTSYSSLFADSQNTNYDGYQQAWRYMGFYIDCSTANSNNNGNNNHRDLKEGEGGNMGCTRYLLWAAYVDLGYEGGGIGEYEYYNINTGDWNDKACQYGVGRCVKMDCHLPDTHFSLLGFFKHDSQAYGEWFGQVFKHEAYCIWSSDEYSYMKQWKDKIPQKCKSTGATSENGTALYYHLKPLSDGNVTIGLYTDGACSQDYTGSYVTIEQLGWDQGYIDTWNEYFGIFKVCQPCTAYSLQYVSSERRELGGQNGIFDCYDDAEYTNVNQCMKFYTKTTMYSASLADVGMAVNQNTTTYSPISAAKSYHVQQREAVKYASYVPKKQPAASMWFLGVSLIAFITGTVGFYWVAIRESVNLHHVFGEPFLAPSPNMVEA